MKIIDFIVCDDIRQETGNKTTLVGIYDSKLTLNLQQEDSIKWPIAMNLAFYGRYLFYKGEQNPDSFQIDFILNSEQPMSVKGKIASPPPETEDRILALLIKMDGFLIAGNGELKANCKFYRNNDLVFEAIPDYRLKILIQQTKS